MVLQWDWIIYWKSFWWHTVIDLINAWKISPKCLQIELKKPKNQYWTNRKKFYIKLEKLENKKKKIDWRNHKLLQRFSFYLYTFRFFITYYYVNHAFFTMICRIFCKNGLLSYLAFLVFTFQVNLCSNFFSDF